MTKSEQRCLRMTAETVKQAEELAAIWSPVKPLSLADAMSECVRRVYESQTKNQEKRR